MRRFPTVLASIASACLAVSACNGSSNSSAQQSGQTSYAKNGTFTMAVPFSPGTFDPYQNRNVLGWSVLAYDSLVNLLPNGEFVSGLAQHWTVSANSVTFTLRRGVTCSDGTSLTASQVASDLTYVGLAQNSPAQYGTNVPTVPYTASANNADQTVKVITERPYGFLLNTIGQVPIMCARGMKDRKLLVSGSDGTGPFVLTSVVPGQSYTFTVRKGYTWGPGGASTSAPGTPAKVVLQVVSSATTAANLLLSGTLNFAQINGPDQQRLAAAGLSHVDWVEAGAWLSFNEFSGRPTADARVRHALASSLDLSQIVKVSTGGTGTAATSLVSMKPNPCPGNTVAGQLPRHDLAAAGNLLNEAGWIKGPSGIRSKDGRPLAIDLHYIPTLSAFEQPTAELLGEEWKAIGVDVTLTPDDASSAIQVVYQTHNYDVYLTGYDFSLPSQMVPYLSGAVPPAGDNTGGFDNAQYNTLAAKAITMTAPKSCAYWNRAAQAIVHNADLVPISDQIEPWFLRKAKAQIQRYFAPVPTSIRVLG